MKTWESYTLAVFRARRECYAGRFEDRAEHVTIIRRRHNGILGAFPAQSYRERPQLTYFTVPVNPVEPRRRRRLRPGRGRLFPQGLDRICSGGAPGWDETGGYRDHDHRSE